MEEGKNSLFVINFCQHSLRVKMGYSFQHHSLCTVCPLPTLCFNWTISYSGSPPCILPLCLCTKLLIPFVFFSWLRVLLILRILDSPLPPGSLLWFPQTQWLSWCLIISCILFNTYLSPSLCKLIDLFLWTMNYRLGVPNPWVPQTDTGLWPVRTGVHSRRWVMWRVSEALSIFRATPHCSHYCLSSMSCHTAAALVSYRS